MSNTLFSGQQFTATRLDDGVVELVLDRQGDSVNKLDTKLTAELSLALDAIDAATDVRGVLLTSGKDAFLAGADIMALKALFDEPREAVAAFSRDMSAVLTRLSDLPVPVVVAINGYALGGGLEVALCADYRVLADNGQIGFPEVGLGILPGAGGTVRTPRLTNAATALDWITGARNHKAAAALKAGMVDAIAAPAELRSTALTWLQRAMKGELDWRARREQQRGPFAVDEDAFAAARESAQRKARHYPAATLVIDLLASCSPLSRDASFAHEAAGMATLVHTPTAKALVGIFLASQQIKKKTHAQASAAVKRSAVLGAGIMGGGIAYTTAVRGMPVLLKDIAQPALDLGIGEARKLLAKQIEGGRMKPDKAEAILASITPMLEFEQFDTADIVVEAVVENLKVKQSVLAEVEARVKTGTVLASNTSSLSIADIASTLSRPEDVVGMHFFNPVHLMPLVEIVKGPQTREEAIAKTVGYALAMGKTPLVVKDCAGFLVNRILGAYFTALLQLIHDGVDFVRIDRVMESWGWPMGPAYLLDVAGIDTLDKAMAILAKAYPSVMGTDFQTAFQLLASEKRYGQKTGAGFYRYEPDAKGRPKRAGDPATYELLKPIQTNAGAGITDGEILDRMMIAMVLEADRCLEQGIAADMIDVDAGMRLGTGFPPHHGGPLWYADAQGLRQILDRAEALATARGGLYSAGDGLRRRVAEAGSYY